MATRGAGRSAIVWRAAAAILGGYGLAALLAVAAGIGLPVARAEAVVAGMLIGVPAWVAIWVWAFAARSPARVWMWIGTTGAALGLLAWLMQDGGGP